MEMGSKIKMLREEKGLTLEQLGDKIGVGKSTVRKWENGMIANMRRDKISLIADALNVSPAYLMGWTESPDAEVKEESSHKESDLALSDLEKHLIARFRTLSEGERNMILRSLGLEEESREGCANQSTA